MVRLAAGEDILGQGYGAGWGSGEAEDSVSQAAKAVGGTAGRRRWILCGCRAGSAAAAGSAGTRDQRD
eukprot:617994-Prymnesium_polylepis.1